MIAPKARSLAGLALCLAAGSAALGQKPVKTRADSVRDSTLSVELTAGEADNEPMRRNLLRRLEWNLGFTTVHVGGGLLFEWIAYSQDSASKEQFPDLTPQYKFRDGRFLLGGRFKTKRPFTWQAGIMWDQLTNKFLVRQSGFMVSVPEIYSHFFIGRSKEGFSQNKVMNGYDGWSMERLPFTDATVPLLADGIKWLGYIPTNHLFWNVGVFGDGLSEGQTFSSYNHQFVARAGWDPFPGDSSGKLLHMAMNFRIGDADKDSLRLRSKPEAFPAPYFIDTGRFPASSALAFGPELYYRLGRVLMGGEYYWQKVQSPQTDDPWFHGGEAMVSWVTSGEARPFNLAGNYFTEVVPDSTVIQGAAGAWAPLLKVSYSNLTNGPIQGGILWRITPMINWYLTDNVRWEFAYGYAVLTRFELRGATMFFQSRIQLRL
jgi:phosphate-selective porin OprO/OprP